MLFSDPATARFLETTFECAWQSVAPVPRATIDFGNGHVLERTLAGNVATWVCTPDGHAVHVLPGLFTPDRYVDLLRMAAGVAERARVDGLDAITEFHRACLLPVVAAEAPRLDFVDVGKGIVEDPIKRGLGLPLGHGAQRAGLADRAPGRADLMKSRVESTVAGTVARTVSTGGAAATSAEDRATLEADNHHNETVRLPEVHRLMAARRPTTPGELTRELYREVLHVDLDDPFLGLAPTVLGGEIGRR